MREFGVTSHVPALESEVEHACSEEDPASDKQTSKYEQEHVLHIRREQIPVSTSDASTRQSLSRSSPKTFPPLRTPRAPRVPPSPTSNSKTSGAGAGDQLRLQQHEVSRSTPVQDAKIPSEGNLRSTKVLRKVGGAAEVLPVSRRRGWRHFRLRLTSYAYVQDGYYRALRRLLYVTTCI